MHGSYAPVRTSAPVETPVSLDEVKTHCRVDHDDDDASLTIKLAAAVSELDGWSGSLGRALVTQSWAQAFDGFPLRLRLPLVAVSVASLTYVDTEGATQTLASNQYVLRRDALGSFVEPAYGVDWPAVRAQTASVTVTFVCGQAAADVPANIKNAILMRVEDLHQNRGSGDANPTINVLLEPFLRAGL